MPEDLIPVFDVTMNLRHFEPELVGIAKDKNGMGPLDSINTKCD